MSPASIEKNINVKYLQSENLSTSDCSPSGCFFFGLFLLLQSAVSVSQKEEKEGEKTRSSPGALQAGVDVASRCC